MDMTADHISDIMNISGNGSQFTGVCVVSEFLENFSGVFRHVIPMTFAVFCVANHPQKFICLFYVYFDVWMVFYLFQSNHFFILFHAVLSGLSSRAIPISESLLRMKSDNCQCFALRSSLRVSMSICITSSSISQEKVIDEVTVFRFGIPRISPLSCQ